MVFDIIPRLIYVTSSNSIFMEFSWTSANNVSTSNIKYAKFSNNTSCIHKKIYFVDLQRRILNFPLAKILLRQICDMYITEAISIIDKTSISCHHNNVLILMYRYISMHNTLKHMNMDPSSNIVDVSLSIVIRLLWNGLLGSLTIVSRQSIKLACWRRVDTYRSAVEITFILQQQMQVGMA